MCLGCSVKIAIVVILLISLYLVGRSMSKRQEFIAAINVLRAASRSITSEQQKGLLQQAVHEYGLTVDEEVEILNATGLIVGEAINYLEVLGLTIDDIENRNDVEILVLVNETHRKAYGASLQAGGLPRADGRSQTQWRTILNQARETLTHPHKRRHYLEKYVHQKDTSKKSLEGTQQPRREKQEVKPPQETIRASLSNSTSTQKVQTPDEAPDSMVFIPGGEFLMGSEDKSGVSDDNPLHSVYVDSFYMDKYPVTNTQFKMFVETNPQWRKPNDLYFWNVKWNTTKKKPEHDGDYLKHWHDNTYSEDRADHPVTWVSWYAAMAYTAWVGKRLPTEAEWEKAARGGVSGQIYPCGNMIDSTMANYNNTVGDSTEVGQYPANGYGLYDMVGNVWEWCLDVYDDGFYLKSSDHNPISGANSVQSVTNELTDESVLRVLRGGSWLDAPQLLQTAFRYKNNPRRTLGRIGFRCVKTVDS